MTPGPGNGGPGNDGPGNDGPAATVPLAAGALAAGALAAGAPVIELRGVGFRYPGQRRPDERDPALTGHGRRRLDRIRPRRHRPAQHCRNGLPAAALSLVDLTVSAGELVTLTGPARSGRSGRSTLLSVVGLLLRPTTGSYWLNGFDTARLGDRDRAALRGRQIGMVSQPVQLLLSRPALDNVMVPLLYLGAPGRLRQRLASAALDRVGLGARAHVAAGDLAADERQRVAIARALVTEPSLLLCDDPTASLDPDLSAQVIGLLSSLRSDGTTVLVATRDQLAAAYASRCVRIGDSRVSETSAAR